MGIVYTKLKKYDKSLEYYQKTLNNCVKTGNKKLQAACLNNIGMVYWYLKNYNKALGCYINAIKMSEESNDKWSISNCSRNIGEVYIKLHDYDNASLYLKNGLEIAEEIGSKHLIKDCYVTFSELYYAKGNYKKAYDYHKLYSEIKDSIFTKEIGENIAKMEVKFQTVKKTAQVIDIFKNIGLEKELARVKNSVSIRAGKGKRRGRKYKKRKGPLIVIKDNFGIYKSARNIPGIEVVKFENLNCKLLAPGTHGGRLVVWTQSAFKALNNNRALDLTSLSWLFVTSLMASIASASP